MSFRLCGTVISFFSWVRISSMVYSLCQLDSMSNSFASTWITLKDQDNNERQLTMEGSNGDSKLSERD